MKTEKAEMTAMVARFAGPDAAERIAGLYVGDRRGRIAFGTDLVFRMPTIAFADNHAEAGNCVFAYRLDREAKGLFSRLGATHSVDLPLIFEDFMRPFRAVYLRVVPDPRRHRLAVRMRDHWLGFVREGRPGGDRPAYAPEERKAMILDEKGRVVADPEALRRSA